MFGIKLVFAFTVTMVSSLVSAANFTIDPSEVALATRASWCTSQINICGELCDAKTNSCSPEDLSYTCTCTDGSTPDLDSYKNSMAFYICQQAQTDCIQQHENDAQGQSNCTKTIGDNCGTKDASVATTTTATSAASTATGGSATAASASATATSGTSVSKAGAMPTNIQHFGNGAAAVAVGLFAYLL